MFVACRVQFYRCKEKAQNMVKSSFVGSWLKKILSTLWLSIFLQLNNMKLMLFVNQKDFEPSFLNQIKEISIFWNIFKNKG